MKKEVEKTGSKEKDPEMPHYRTPMVEKLEKLSKKGFSVDFQFINNSLRDLSDDKIYNKDQLKIAEVLRFEGISDPDDMAIIYAIETEDGKKGTLTDAFGVYGDAALEAFIKEVEDISGRPC